MLSKVVWWSGLFLIGACISWHFASHDSWALAAVTLFAVPLIALAFTRPILIPYALFVLVIPIDSLLTIGQYGTIARVLGMASGAFILFYNLRRGEFIRPHSVILAIAMFVAYAALTVTWTLDGANGTKTMMTLLQLAGLYLIIATSPLAKRDLRLVLGSVVASGILAAVYGIWTFHGQTLAHEVVRYGRLSLVVGNHNMDVNMYADSLLLPIALSLWAWMRERKFLRWVGLCAILLALFWAVVVSGSRESLIAIAVMVTYIICRSAYRQRVIPLLAAAAIGAALIPSVRARFSQSLATGGAGRLDIWKVGWHAFVAHPIFGAGLGSFAKAYNRSFLGVYQSYDAGWARASHNLFVHYGVEGGALAIVLLVAVWFLQFRQVHELTRFPEVRELGIALTGALIALFIAGLFIDMFESKALWLAFGLIAQVRAYIIWTSPTRVVQSRMNPWQVQRPIVAGGGRGDLVALPR